MRPIMTREGMTLARVAVDRRVRLPNEGRFNRSLRRLRNELVFLGQMHQQRRTKTIDRSQIFLGIATVIPDRSVDAVIAHGCHENHQSAEAIAEQAHLAVAFRKIAYCVDGVLNVLNACVAVIGSVQTKAVLPVGLGSNIQVDARLLPPEQIWCNREVALFCQFVAMLANVGVHSEQLLQNDDSGSRQGLRPCDVGCERTVVPLHADVILHFDLLNRLCDTGSAPTITGRRRSLAERTATYWVQQKRQLLR